jgi:uncharacterized membrane protein
MTLYEFLVFVHVLMAIVWVGGGVAIQVFALRATRSNDSVRVARFSADAEWIGLRVLMPASILLLASGIWAAVEGDWDFGSAWIGIGFAAAIVSFFVGMAFTGPESSRIAKLAEDHGVDHPEVARRVRRITAVSRAELVVLLVAVFAMVVKPGA